MHDDFDTRRAHPQTEASFTIGGERFTYTPQAAADLIAAYFDASNNVGSPTRNGDVLKAADELICSMLPESQHEQWRHVRGTALKPNPLTIRDVQMVADRMLEVMSGHPTEPSSASGTTRERSGTSSTDESPSPAAIP